MPSEGAKQFRRNTLGRVIRDAEQKVSQHLTRLTCSWIRKRHNFQQNFTDSRLNGPGASTQTKVIVSGGCKHRRDRQAAWSGEGQYLQKQLHLPFSWELYCSSCLREDETQKCRHTSCGKRINWKCNLRERWEHSIRCILTECVSAQPHLREKVPERLINSVRPYASAQGFEIGRSKYILCV